MGKVGHAIPPTPFFGSNMARGKSRYAAMSVYLLWSSNNGLSSKGIKFSVFITEEINTSCFTIFPIKRY